MSRSNLPFWAVRVLAAALGLLAAGPARGLVQHPPETSPDSEWAPGINLGPATATVWRWGSNASAVAIGPNDAPMGYRTDYFITTRHQGGGVDTIVNFGGTDYSVYDVFIHPTADLRIVRVRDTSGPAALADWAGFYTATDEVTQTAVIGGFGKSRGDTGPDYYTWAGSDNGTQRWGQNWLVDSVNNVSVSSYKSNVLRACFDSYGTGTWVPYESAIAEFDSGGGWFLPVGDQWKLVGLSAYVQIGGGKSYFGEMLSAIRISSYANWIDAVFKRSTWHSSTGGAWSGTANWSGAVPDGLDKWAVFSDSATAARGITVAANTKLGTLRFNTPGDVCISKTDSGELEFSVTIDSAVLETFSTNGNGALVISAPVKLTSPLLVNHNSAGLVTLSGQVSGNKGLTKSGTGTLVLAASNTFTGGTLVNQGTLRLTSAGALGLLGKTTTLGGGNLEVRSDSSLTYTNGVKATASATINVDCASSGTGQTMTFGALTTENQVTLHVTSGNGYSLAFSGTALINGLSSAGIATIDTAGADLKLLGGLTLNQGTLVKTGPGTLTVAGTQTYGSNTTLKVNQGTLVLNTDAGAVNPYAMAVTVSGAGAAANFGSSQHLADLELGGTGTASVASGGTATVTTRNLSIAGGTSPTARFDLNDNDLIINYAGGTDPVAAVRGYLVAGYDSSTGLWTGEGIVSSAAGILHRATTLGYRDDPGAQEVTVRYTWIGDSNLDGVVDVQDDFSAFLDGLNGKGVSWFYGDLNYDGVVDVQDDFSLFVDGLNQQQGAVLGGSVTVLDNGIEPGALGAQRDLAGGKGLVPEPSTLVLMVWGCVALAARCRRAG